jgi:hypothetical protein
MRPAEVIPSPVLVIIPFGVLTGPIGCTTNYEGVI